MSYDYSRLRATADRLIAKFGVDAILHRPGTVNETTYPTVQLPGPKDPCIVVRDTYSAMERTGTLIEEGDVKLLIAVTDTPPTTADRLEVQGVTYHLQSVDPIQPGPTVLLYQARGRK